MIATTLYPEKAQWDALVRRPFNDVSALFDTVRQVFDAVRRDGDAAVKRYEAEFDHVALSELRVPDEELREADALVSGELKEAIRTAMTNIETFHAAQRGEVKKIETMPGVTCWQKAVAIEKVGLYVPGGTAPLFSTVLMLAVPARLAGCREVVLCTPPGRNGKVHPAILYAAAAAGVHAVFKAGGIQAIAAMTCGTESIPKVYKLFGPGNRYVTAAKQFASLQEVAIDLPAGPSEVAIIADETAHPAFVAADLLAQAEHGADSQSVLVTTSEALAPKVEQALAAQLAQLPRKEIIAQALAHSRIVVLRNRQEAVAFINRYAPEHLIIQTADYAALAEEITNAGSVFLGACTPESAGDYAAGVNHTLPTNGHARAYSGVSLDSFVKKITFEEITPGGIKQLGNTICVMAESEQLEAHRRAVTVRLDTL
jgi:histidinol dehydrogenase